jgi:8-oxo-dGTP pyrophosphatase MutT (NUDIX family)
LLISEQSAGSRLRVSINRDHNRKNAPRGISDMETTRHFVATVYVVNGGATLLHEHAKLGLWLPPGGHIDRDELPHETARREVREETGLDVALSAEPTGLESKSETVRVLPEPEQFLVEDIDVRGGEVFHQHIDFVYYGRADSREIDPEPGETPVSAWEWVTSAELEANADRYPTDVIEMAIEAIEHAGPSEESE